jgi:archaellum biogenesis protein FlaJ (TadC family)
MWTSSNPAPTFHQYRQLQDQFMIARIVTSLIGFVLIVYGIIAAVSPLPAGVILAIVGMLMIAGANPAARPIIRKARRRWRWFDVLVRTVGKHGPPHVRRVAEATSPEHNDETDSAAEGANPTADKGTGRQ